MIRFQAYMIVLHLNDVCGNAVFTLPQNIHFHYNLWVCVSVLEHTVLLENRSFDFDAVFLLKGFLSKWPISLITMQW